MPFQKDNIVCKEDDRYTNNNKKYFQNRSRAKGYDENNEEEKSIDIKIVLIIK